MTHPEDDDVAFHRDHVISHLRDLAALAIESDDLHTVGRVTVALDAIADLLVGKRGVSGIRDEVDAHLLACLDGRGEAGVNVGGWRLVKHYSKPRKAWQWDALFGALAPKVRELPRFVFDSGEFEDDTARAFRVLRDCVGLSAGKVTGLRNLGLDPDEFCESGVSVCSVERQRLLTEVTG